ncbi:MAG: DUF655 domain-containing protein [Crenarchaeota archaeon]|nr:DUF655 domain-containing protein [Thermoproteota archaeon]
MHRGRRRRGRREKEPRYYELYAYVLDYLPLGNPIDRHPAHRNRPVVQLIGEDYFMLLEATPRPNASLSLKERVYVGPEKELRLKIQRIDTAITYDDLTSVARDTLNEVLEEIIKAKEKVFVEFFNIAGPITLRMHSLELLPGVGKKTLMKILKQRETRPFESFEDIRERVNIDPVKAIKERIIAELKGGEKYYLFVKPPRRPGPQAVQPLYLRYLERIYQKLGMGRGGAEGQAT